MDRIGLEGFYFTEKLIMHIG